MSISSQLSAPASPVNSNSSQLESIEKALGESSQMNRNIGISFLLYLIFCFYMTLATNDLMLFLPDVFRLDLTLVQLRLNIEKFYLMAPFFLVFFHYNILNNLVHHIYKVAEWDYAVYENRKGLHLIRHGFNQSIEVKEIELHKKQHVKPFLVNYCFIKYGERFANYFVKTVFFFFTFLLPLSVLCFMLVRFAEYQSIGYTTCHFSLLYIDFGLCIIFMSNIMRIIQNKNSRAFNQATTSPNRRILADWFWRKKRAIKDSGRLSDTQKKELDRLTYLCNFNPLLNPSKIAEKESAVYLDLLALKTFTEFYYEEKEIADRKEVHNNHTIAISLFHWFFLVLSLLTLKLLFDVAYTKPSNQAWAFYLLGLGAFTSVALFAMVFVPATKALPLFLERSPWVKFRRWVAVLSLLGCVSIGLYYLASILDGQRVNSANLEKPINSVNLWDKVDYHLDIRNEKFHDKLYPNDPLIGVQWERREVRNRSLRSADLYQTDLTGFQFNNVFFGENNMLYTRFDDVHFYKSSFENVEFRYNSFVHTFFDSCNFVNCRFYAPFMSGTVFNACRIYSTVFDTAEMHNCLFENNAIENDTFNRSRIVTCLFGNNRGEGEFLFRNNRFVDSTLFVSPIRDLHESSDAAFKVQCYSCIAYDTYHNKIVRQGKRGEPKKWGKKTPDISSFPDVYEMPSAHFNIKSYYQQTSAKLKKG